VTVRQRQRARPAPRPDCGQGRGAAGWPAACGLAAGAALDALIADPRRGHPVALFGRTAGAIETRMYSDSKIRGGLHAAACLLAATAPAALAHHLTRGRPALRMAATAAASWTVIGAASLAQEAKRLARAIESGDLAAARACLPSLCGRDPAGLDAAGLARAAVESVAENTCDAVVAPLMWGSAAGITGLAAYRAVNTLDAMIGHRSARYRAFGWAAARLDDVAGAAPARLTGLLAAACAPVAGGRPAEALRGMKTFGNRHPSPNAGRCEAAFAGALGIQLGGTNVYDGVTEDRPILGTGRDATAEDIRRAVRLSRAVTWAAVTVATALAAASRRHEPPGPRRGIGGSSRLRQVPGSSGRPGSSTGWLWQRAGSDRPVATTIRWREATAGSRG
jgi:adenosylcobinamide-phosphate synthase